MTVSIPAKQFAPGSAYCESSSGFETVRGQFIDSFCELEVAIGLWLKFLGSKASSAQSFSAKLALLANSEVLPLKAGKKQVLHIQNLTEKAAFSIQLRNTLVHHRRTGGTHNGEPCVMLQNLEDVIAGLPRYTVITERQLLDAASDVRKIATQLKAWLNQASSPPPPSPAATVDL